MSRVLVVEDEPDIADFIRRGLTYKGYEVDVAGSGEEALERARDQLPDLVILDLMLPGVDGVEVCRRLRAAEEIPIIILTARDTVADKVNGLEAGADDYVTKPFEFAELLARVGAALRRQQAKTGAAVIRVADLVIQPSSREVLRGTREVELSAREYDLLEFLARHVGEVVSKETLFEKVWGYDFEVESDAIKVYVRYLRRKLNASGEPDLIHSVRGVGYMLKARQGTTHEPALPRRI